MPRPSGSLPKFHPTTQLHTTLNKLLDAHDSIIGILHTQAVTNQTVTWPIEPVTERTEVDPDTDPLIQALVRLTARDSPAPSCMHVRTQRNEPSPPPNNPCCNIPAPPGRCPVHYLNETVIGPGDTVWIQGRTRPRRSPIPLPSHHPFRTFFPAANPPAEAPAPPPYTEIEVDPPPGFRPVEPEQTQRPTPTPPRVPRPPTPPTPPLRDFGLLAADYRSDSDDNAMEQVC